ncbi:MAG: stage II sporulation protein M [Nanobdellota archaeon]
MILDFIFSPKRAEEKPWLMIFIGMFYAAVALPISYIIDKSNASMIMVFLTVTAAMPFIYNIIKYEERKDETIKSEKILLKEHSRALKAFMFMFFGMVITFSLAKAFLPDMIATSLFSAQEETIHGIINGKATSSQGLFEILFNNINVFFLCIAFSFIYGMGAIYILTWNATVLGTAVGNFISSNLANISHLAGLDKGIGYFKVFSCGYFLRYLPHGVIEILAFFIGGLAGAIVSVAVVKKTFGTKTFANIITDSSDLILIALLLIVIAALVEVFVTPVIFTNICR